MNLEFDLSDYLLDSEFKKWAVVISKIVWNKSYRMIEEKIGCDYSWASKVVRKFEEDGRKIIDHRINNGGQNSKMEEEVLDYIEDYYHNNRNALNRDVISGLERDMKVRMSESTLKEAKKSLGFVANKPKIIRDITPENILERFQYCQDHLNDKFSNCLFTDESSVQLFENRSLVWWQPSFEERPELLMNPKKGKIMVWGGISRRKKTELVIIRINEEEKVDKFYYRNILNDYCVKCMNATYGTGHWRLMQDNATPHKAGVIKNWLKENKIRAIDHPSYSPDLNPIEKVWNYIKQQLYHQPFSCLQELEYCIKSIWQSIDLVYINKLIDNHLKTLKLVYDFDGAYL